MDSESSLAAEIEDGEELYQEPGSPAQAKRRRFEDEVDDNRRERNERQDNEAVAEHDYYHQQPAAPSTAADTKTDSDDTVNNGKRFRAERAEGESGSVPDAAAADALDLRFLFDSNHIGAIIGRAGATIKKLREDFGCYINILQTEREGPAHTSRERVMMLRGSHANVMSTITAILDICSDSSGSGRGRGDAGRPAQSEDPDSGKVVLLVHRQLVGAIIGKGGDTIRATSGDTGARIQVGQETLPQSTEKSVTVSGKKDSVLDAVGRIVTQLKSSPPLKAGTATVHYVPQPLAPRFPSPYDHHPALPPYYAPPPHTVPPPMHGGRFDDRRSGYEPRGGYGYPPSAAHSAYPRHDDSAPLTEQKIAIPSVCAGCVIGRGGEVIRSLRQQSGCSITVNDADPSEPTERVVIIKGGAANIQSAVRLIRQCVENYRPPREDRSLGQPPQSHAQQEGHRD